MRIFTILAILIASSILTSCKEATGTCETSLINYQGKRIYKCTEDNEDWLCDGKDSDYEQAFYKGKNCSDLGYGYQDSDGDWVYSSTSNSDPGSYGKWGSGSSGGGGGGGSCSAGYKPISDPQLNAYCGTAYAYRCLDGKSLNSKEVQSVCKIYDQMKEPGVPACAYCR